MMNRRDLRDEVRRRTGDWEAAAATDTDLNAWLNLSIKSLWNSYPWPFRRVTSVEAATANQDYITLPTTAEVVKKVSNITSTNVLQPARPSWLLDVYPPGSSTGEPRYYTDGGYSQTAGSTITRKLLLYPTPDQVYSLSVQYERTPPALTADTSYPPFPETADEALLAWVLGRFYRKSRDLDSAVFWDRAYDSEVGNLIVRYGANTGESFPAIEPDVYDTLTYLNIPEDW